MSIIKYLNESLIHDSYITEGLGVTYHATEPEQLKSIFATGCIDLSPAIGADIESKLSKGKYYYLSTMRTKTGRYMMGSGYVKKNAYLELDHDALTNNLKSTPVDYWGGDPSYSEHEERLLSDNDKICGIDKYIKSAHVLIDKRIVKENEEKYLTMMMSLYLLASHHTTPVYFYTESSKYIAGKGGMSIDDYFKSIGKDKHDYYNLGRDRPHIENNIDAIIDFYGGEKISRDTYNALENLRWDVNSNYSKDFIIDIKNDMTGGRRQGGSDRDRENVKQLISIMKKYKSRSIEDFYKDVFIPDMNKRFKWDIK